MKFSKTQNLTDLFSFNFYQPLNIGLSKDTIIKLYKSLSLRTLSGEQQIEFEKLSDLTALINFKIKHSILTNLDNQEKNTR